MYFHKQGKSVISAVPKKSIPEGLILIYSAHEKQLKD